MTQETEPSAPATIGDAAGIAASFPCLVVGPRSRASGRNYEVNFLSPSARLTPKASALLNDFILALAGWASRGSGGFSTFFSLDAAAGLCLLVKASHLGRGDRGTVAVAHGVLIHRDQLPLLRRRPHRLLELIPDPATGPWRPDLLDVRRDRVDANPAPPAGFVPFGEMVALSHHSFHATVAPGERLEKVMFDLLEAIPTTMRDEPFTWSDTGLLPTIGGFDPRGRDLIVTQEGVPGFDLPPATHRIAAGAVAGPIAPVPAEHRAWRTLFDARAIAGAPSLVGTSEFDKDSIGLGVEACVARAITRLVTPALSLSDFWLLLAWLAEGTSRLVDLDERAQAARGIGQAFGAISPPDAQRLGPLAREFLERVQLPEARDMLRALIVVRDAVAEVEEGVAALIPGMTGDFADALIGTLESGRQNDKGVAATALALCGRLEDRPTTDDLRVIPVALRAAVRKRRRGGATAGAAGLALAEQLFSAPAAGGSEWTEAAERGARAAAHLALAEPAAADRLLTSCAAALRLQEHGESISIRREESLAGGNSAWRRAASLALWIATAKQEGAA